MTPYKRLFEDVVPNILVKNQKAWKIFRSLFPHTPEYVLLSIFEVTFDAPHISPSIVDNAYQFKDPVKILSSNYNSYPEMEELAELLNGKWVRKILNVTLADFSPYSQKVILERDFGRKNPYDVPRDLERTQYQQERLLGDGRNEPVVLGESSEGYDIYEGFHRTMVLLDMAEKTGKPVKLNAWVRLQD